MHPLAIMLSRESFVAPGPFADIRPFLRVRSKVPCQRRVSQSPKRGHFKQRSADRLTSQIETSREGATAAWHGTLEVCFVATPTRAGRLRRGSGDLLLLNLQYWRETRDGCRWCIMVSTEAARRYGRPGHAGGVVVKHGGIRGSVDIGSGRGVGALFLATRRVVLLVEGRKRVRCGAMHRWGVVPMHGKDAAASVVRLHILWVWVKTLKVGEGEGG